MSVGQGEIPFESGWKPILRLSEDLARLPSSAHQAQHLSHFIERRLSCKSRVWLSGLNYPLPGEPEGDFLPSTNAPGLVNTAFSSGRARFFPPLILSVKTGTSNNRTLQAAVPLVSNDKLLGILFCERPPDRAFSPDELSMLEEIVNFSSHAFEIKRQQVVKDWHMEQLMLVSSVSGQIANVFDQDTLYHRVTQLIQETFDLYYVAIFTPDPDRSHFSIKAFASQALYEHPPVSSVAIGYGMVGCAAKSGDTCIAQDVFSSPNYQPVETLPETRSEIALPIKIENRILGVLDVQSDRTNDFHENDILVLRSLADNIALAIEGTNLYQDVQRRAEQITTIHEVSRALTSILDLDLLLDEVVKLIQNHFGFPYVHIFTVHKNRGAILYRAGSGGRSTEMRSKAFAYRLNDPTGIIPWVAREGTTVLANDIAQDPRYRPSELPPDNTQSELTIPLSFGSEVLGILDIQSDQKNSFKEYDLPLFEALSANIAIAIRNAILYQSERWRRQVAESLRDIATLVSGNTQLDQLLNAILNKLEQHLECRASAIWLVSKPEKTSTPPITQMELEIARGISGDLIRPLNLQEPTFRTWLENIGDLRLPVIRLPEHGFDPLGHLLQYPETYSALTIPLRSGDHLVGIVLIAHPDPAKYGGDAQAVAATFAGYAAGAIQNTRLFQEAQEQAVISTLLLQVAEATQVTSSLDELLKSMVSFTRFLEGVKKNAFFIFNDQSQTFHMKCSFGFPNSPTDYKFPVTLFPAFERLYNTHELQVVCDTIKDLPLPGLSPACENGKIFLFPIHVRGAFLGAYLVVVEQNVPNDPAKTDEARTLSILQGIAHQASIAIDNIRLEEARQEETYVTIALLQVAQTVAALKTLSEILDTIIHLVPMLVGVDACLVYTWDETNQLFIPSAVNSGSHIQDEIFLQKSFSRGEFPLLDEILAKGIPNFCTLPDHMDVNIHWPPPDSLPLDQISNLPLTHKGNWLMGFPLSVQGRGLGALLVMETNVSPVYRERRIEIVTGIAQQTAIAVENDRLQREMVQSERIEREIQLARQIQKSFLPEQLLEIAGWDLDSRWRTAREVGGDFYDVFLINPGSFGIVIADVADKGIPAALYMAVTRSLIRAYMRNISSPSLLLDQINDLLLSESTNSMFITALYGVLDVQSGIFSYANAGHNLPIIVRADGQIETLKRGGIALGVQDDTRLEDQFIRLRPGDLIYFYTDGVTDTNSPSDEFFGEERLKQILASHAIHGAKAVLNAVDEALCEFSQDQIPSDDITMLAISRSSQT